MKRWVALAAWLAASELIIVFPASADDTAVSEESAPAVAASQEAMPVEARVETEIPELKPRILFQCKSYPEVWQAAQTSNRMILVYVSMPRCVYCDKMKQHTYCRTDVRNLLLDSCETLSVCRSTHPELVRKLHVKLYPTTLLVSPNNKVLDVIEGYVDAKVLRRRVKTQLARLENNGSLH